MGPGDEFASFTSPGRGGGGDERRVLDCVILLPDLRTCACSPVTSVARVASRAV